MKHLKTIILCGIIILISACSLLSDMLMFNPSVAALNPGYWLNAILVNVLTVTIIFLSSSLRKDKLTATHEVYTELHRALLTAYKDINEKSLETTFRAYIDEDNRAAKLKSYKEKLSGKLGRTRDKIKRMETRYNTWRVWRKQDPTAEPRTWRLVSLRAKAAGLEKKLETAEGNIEYIRVRYRKVSYSSIFGESGKAGGDERDMSYHTAVHDALIVAKKASLVVAIGFVSMLNMGDPQLTFTIYTAYKMGMKLFQIGMALYTGISDADKFVAGDMCNALRRRINYVQAFSEAERRKEGKA